jgi:hypothetical protein
MWYAEYTGAEAQHRERGKGGRDLFIRTAASPLHDDHPPWLHASNLVLNFVHMQPSTVTTRSVDTVAIDVERRIRRVLELERDRWTAVDWLFAEPIELLDDYVLGGGERVRPPFCRPEHLGAGGDQTPASGSTPLRGSSCCTTTSWTARRCGAVADETVGAVWTGWV